MILEVASFRLSDGADEQAFLREHRRVHENWVVQQPGFVSRRTTKSPDGDWKDVVTWESMEAAQAASEKLMGAAEAGPWMRMMDPASVAMYHGELVLDL